MRRSMWISGVIYDDVAETLQFVFQDGGDLPDPPVDGATVVGVTITTQPLPVKRQLVTPERATWVEDIGGSPHPMSSTWNGTRWSEPQPG